MTNNTQKKIGGKINFALILLIFVIIITVGLYGYNQYIESQNKKLDDRITKKQNQIEEINKDKNIQIYALIKKNQKTLNKLESYSKITKIINAMAYIKYNYKINLEGFNYSNGTLSTKAFTNENDNAYMVVSNFISRYRKDKKALFELAFISRVIGNKQIAFNLNLKVKDNLINNKK